ncbi:DUF3387 domain-containing protein [Escherichia coli]|nr:DUF3387 domain-containing protein [Escherichia coli]
MCRFYHYNTEFNEVKAPTKKAKAKKGFEETLWDTANQLRGSVESSEYKHVVLSLVLLKLISDKFESRRKKMIAEALKADGVEEIYFLGDKKAESIDIFDEDYLARINKIKLPATKIQLLQKLLEKAISDFKKVNQLQGINFTRRFQVIIDRYNERREDDVLNGEEFDTFSQEMTDIIYDIKTEKGTWADLGIDIEEKAFFDILAHMRDKYQFTYDDEKMLSLAKEMKSAVDNTSKYPDWSKRDDIKAKLKVEIILLLHKHKFPPVSNDDVYMGVLAQAENFKEHHMMCFKLIMKAG